MGKVINQGPKSAFLEAKLKPAQSTLPQKHQKETFLSLPWK